MNNIYEEDFRAVYLAETDEITEAFSNFKKGAQNEV